MPPVKTTTSRPSALAKTDRHIPLPDGLRESFEHSFAADLRAVRLHTGPAADRVARRFGATAVASGANVYLRDGAYRPDTRAGQWLLAHETAHLVQQARGEVGGTPMGPWRVSTPGDAWEREADRYAEAALAARPADPGAAPVRVVPHRSRVIQRHVSFEHRVLGDVATADLLAVATNGAQRADVLKKQIGFLYQYHDAPDKVDDKAILAAGMTPVQLGPDRVWVTYGELNALPDYLANPQAMDQLGATLLLPILQVIRQEGYNQLTKLLTGSDPRVTFAGAACSPWPLDMINALVETLKLDQLTLGLGAQGQDHYQGLLARNACHFAPYSWYRWQASHLAARDLAGRAYREKNPELARLARVYHGYADHFLQDSFAAGHLVNKTLVMQWFIQWAAAQGLLWVADLDRIKDMTVVAQPNLADRQLYDAAFAGPANDPQTVQEAATLVERLFASGVIETGSTDQEAAYQNYLTFLTSAAAQLASANMHDYYNSNSLWVASPQHSDPYLVWGDDTLLSGKNGGAGVQETSAAAQLSQRALREILETGGTTVQTADIRMRIPTKAGADPGSVTDLLKWNDAQRPFCEKTFAGFIPTLTNLLSRLTSPRLGITSQDQRFAVVWSASLPSARYFTADTVFAAGRLFTASNGMAYELDPMTSRVLHSRSVGISGLVQRTETRPATDGTRLFIGIDGGVVALPVGGDWSAGTLWSTLLLNTPDRYGSPVSVLVDHGRLYVGTGGGVFELDPATGKVLHQLQLTSLSPSPALETRLSTDGSTLFAGVHGYAYAVPLSTFAKPTWYTRVGGGGLTFPAVTVLAARGTLYVGCDGYAHELDPANGAVRHTLYLPGSGRPGIPPVRRSHRAEVPSVPSVGSPLDYTVQLALGGDRLFAGVHGYVYGVRLDQWSPKTTWYSAVSGHGWEPVSVLVLGDRLFAGSNGYAHQLNTATGLVEHTLELTFLVGLPTDDYETRLASDGQYLYAGVHGYLNKILVNDTRVNSTIHHQQLTATTKWQPQWTPRFDGAPDGIRQVVGDVVPQATLVTLAIDEGGRLYVDYQLNDGKWAGSWTPLTDAPLARSIRALRSPAGYLEVFLIGADGVLYNSGINRDAWRASWVSSFDNAPLGIDEVGGAMGPTGNLELFAVGSDGTLYHNIIDPKGKSQGQWTPNFRGAPPVRSVTSAMGPTGHLEVFAVGADEVLYHNTLDPKAGWQPTWHVKFDNAPPVQAVAAAMAPTGELEVLAVGTDDKLYRNRLNQKTGWQGGWTPNMDGAPTVQSIGAMLGPTGYLEIFAVGTDNRLYHDSVYSTGWQGKWVPDFLGAPPTRAVSMARGHTGSLEVFAVTAT
jgi:hypothetical protein